MENKKKQGLDLSTYFTQQKANTALAHTSQVDQRAIARKEAEFSPEFLDKIHKGYKRLEKSEKNKREMERRFIEGLKSKRDEKLQQVKGNHQNLKGEAKEKYRYLQDKDD